MKLQRDHLLLPNPILVSCGACDVIHQIPPQMANIPFVWNEIDALQTSCCQMTESFACLSCKFVPVKCFLFKHKIASKFCLHKLHFSSCFSQFEVAPQSNRTNCVFCTNVFTSTFCACGLPFFNSRDSTDWVPSAFNLVSDNANESAFPKCLCVSWFCCVRDVSHNNLTFSLSIGNRNERILTLCVWRKGRGNISSDNTSPKVQTDDVKISTGSKLQIRRHKFSSWYHATDTSNHQEYFLHFVEWENPHVPVLSQWSACVKQPVGNRV